MTDHDRNEQNDQPQDPLDEQEGQHQADGEPVGPPAPTREQKLEALADEVREREGRNRKDQLQHVKTQAAAVLCAWEQAQYGEWGPWCVRAGISQPQAWRYRTFGQTIRHEWFERLTEDLQWAEWQRVSGNAPPAEAAGAEVEQRREGQGQAREDGGPSEPRLSADTAPATNRVTSPPTSKVVPTKSTTTKAPPSKGEEARKKLADYTRKKVRDLGDERARYNDGPGRLEFEAFWDRIGGDWLPSALMPAQDEYNSDLKKLRNDAPQADRHAVAARYRVNLIRKIFDANVSLRPKTLTDAQRRLVARELDVSSPGQNPSAETLKAELAKAVEPLTCEPEKIAYVANLLSQPTTGQHTPAPLPAGTTAGDEAVSSPFRKARRKKGGAEPTPLENAADEAREALMKTIAKLLNKQPDEVVVAAQKFGMSRWEEWGERMDDAIVRNFAAAGAFVVSPYLDRAAHLERLHGERKEAAASAASAAREQTREQQRHEKDDVDRDYRRLVLQRIGDELAKLKEVPSVAEDSLQFVLDQLGVKEYATVAHEGLSDADIEALRQDLGPVVDRHLEQLVRLFGRRAAAEARAAEPTPTDGEEPQAPLPAPAPERTPSAEEGEERREAV
jgi:hypothetical protein